MAAAEPMFLLPVRFTTANPVLRIHPDSGGAGSAQDVTITVSANTNYYLSGDDDTTSGDADLVKILEDALNTNTDAETFTVAISNRNFITISTASNVFQILWSHANTTVEPEIFGFPAATDSTGANSYAAPDQTKFVWIPGTSTRTQAVLEDTEDHPVVTGALMHSIDGSARGYQLSSSNGERRVSFHLLDREKVLTAQADATEPYGALEWAWTNGFAQGRRVRLYDDKTSRTTSSYSLYRTKTMTRPWQLMEISRLRRYTAEFNLRATT